MLPRPIPGSSDQCRGYKLDLLRYLARFHPWLSQSNNHSLYPSTNSETPVFGTNS